MRPNPNWRGDPTFLPDLFRAFGIPFRELPGWKDWGMGDFGAIQGIFWHHTGGPCSAEYIARNAGLGGALSSQIHLSPKALPTLCGAGWAYHAGKGWGHGWPTNNANPFSIGMEMEADGTSPWPAEQLDIARRITAVILWFLGKRATPATMIGHWEYSMQAQGKWDPGAGNGISGAVMDMNAQRAQVNQLIDNINKYGVLDPTTGKEGDVLTITYFTDFIKGFFTPQFQKLDELKAMLSDIFTQLRGPGAAGWPQLGKNAQGQNLTLVDAVAALRQDVNGLRKLIEEKGA